MEAPWPDARPATLRYAVDQRDDCQANAWCFFKRSYGITSTEVACADDMPDAGTTPPPSDPPGCGCGSGPASTPTLLLLSALVLFLLRRRRRTGNATSPRM